MTTISMNEFRRDADSVILKVQQGETVVLTDDGKPGVRLQPVEPIDAKAGNGLSWMCELGERLVPPGPMISLTNEEIDRIVYAL